MGHQTLCRLKKKRRDGMVTCVSHTSEAHIKKTKKTHKQHKTPFFCDFEKTKTPEDMRRNEKNKTQTATCPKSTVEEGRTRENPRNPQQQKRKVKKDNWKARNQT
jgi:hypothetical protein